LEKKKKEKNVFPTLKTDTLEFETSSLSCSALGQCK